jgi:hypothetical protein
MGVKISSPSGVQVTGSALVPYGEGPVCELALDPSAPVIIGILDASGFEAARSLMPELQSYVDYGDWLDVREGAQIGWAMTGVDARIVPVDFQRFVSWCEAACLKPSEAALDAYARTVVQSPAEAPSSLS